MKTAFSENPLIAHQKVHDRAEADGQDVRDEIVQVQNSDEDLHDDQVTQNRDESGCQVEAQQALERLGPPAAPAAGTCPPLVPHEVVKDGGFDGEDGCEPVVEPHPAGQDDQRRHLQDEAH
jgi:hypothetical protein